MAPFEANREEGVIPDGDSSPLKIGWGSCLLEEPVPSTEPGSPALTW